MKSSLVRVGEGGGEGGAGRGFDSNVKAAKGLKGVGDVDGWGEECVG